MKPKMCGKYPLCIPESCIECLLGEKTITQNGEYLAIDDGYDGYHTVVVNVSRGANIPTRITATSPTKSSYQTGEQLDLTGVVVTAYYADGTTRNVTSSCTFSPADGSTLNTPGTQTITITYSETVSGQVITLTTTVSVAVELPLPAKIRVTTLPTKITYDDGEAISKTGMVVKAYNADDTIWDYLSYTGGVIPNNEIALNPNVSSLSHNKKTAKGPWSDDEFTVLPSFHFDVESTSSLGSGQCGFKPYDGTAVCTYYYDDTYKYCIVASDQPVAGDKIFYDSVNRVVTYRNVGWGHYDQYDQYYIYNNKKVYYASMPVVDDSMTTFINPEDAPYFNDSDSVRRAAWTIVYGNVAVKESIQVNWPRVGDGHILTTSFNINLNELPNQIKIAQLPNKMSYLDGDSLDKSGMVVKAYCDIYEWSGYPNGVIPNNDIVLSPSTASFDSQSASGHTSTQTITVSWTCPDDNNTMTTQFVINVVDELPAAVSWSSGTDDQIVALIQAAHGNIIDLHDYAGWSVGDVRSIPVGDYNYDIVISSFDDYMDCGCVMQFDFKDCYFRERPWYDGSSYRGNYGGSYMQRTVLPDLEYRLPTWLKNILIEFNVQVATLANYPAPLTTVAGNKLALRSEAEVIGTRNVANAIEGSIIPYYETAANRIKNRNGSVNAWSLRSPNDTNGQYMCIVDTDGTTNWNYVSNSWGVAPFGCL